ncbi:hypothetical protein LCGC14_0947800 [marine sediment metagenome]|uniref:Uncharacterized protein n=1 Tax=marine sediment metagenome TaxID=412755 RepID=A0A0F9NIA6_9ZZZZ
MYLRTLSFVCFGDDDAAAAAEKAAAEKKEASFTQEEVNTFLAKEKRKTQDAQKQLALKLQEYKKSAQLSGDEKGDLEKQIEDLQKQYMTVEERGRQTSEKASKKHKKELDDASSERDTWKTRYTQSTIQASIAQAAVTNKAIAVDQISAMLRPAAKLTEKLDEQGKPTGVFEPRVDFQDMDKDEKPIMLDLSIDQAVKRMSELSQYGNLFQGNKTGGLGGSGGTNSNAGKIDIVKIAHEDPARYRELRKKQPELLASM